MASHKNHQDPEFKHLREVVLWLHDYRCYICKEQKEYLEVHHLGKDSKKHYLKGLVPACKQCHVYLGRITEMNDLSNADITKLLEDKKMYYYYL